VILDAESQDDDTNILGGAHVAKSVRDYR
jgi:hypothetical protein